MKAHLQLALPTRAVSFTTGQYGSLLETAEALGIADVDHGVVLIEWPDIDPRLGIRHLGGWTPAALDDILLTADHRLRQLLEILKTISIPLALVLPSLPMPPAAFTTTIEAGPFDLQLQKLIADFGVSLPSSIVVLKAAELDRLSPLSERHDISSELSTGFPYSRGHADFLASLLTRIIAPASPKKGLITDLDDTLWLGILGDDGVDGLSWDLDHQSQMHGAYQQLLRSLSESGVLLAAASKNDPSLVDVAFNREDLLLRRTDLYPVEAHWQSKSVSITRILEKWNIGADSVVFIDDSPMELDEVKSVHPAIECILFPKEDPAAIYQLMYRLRDLFGKRQILEEDRIRAVSIRNFQSSLGGVQPHESVERFLENVQSCFSFSFTKQPLDPRILELINKTNQFNLNGKRYLDREWQAYVQAPDSVILLVAYEDKYGPLGKIAALGGHLTGKRLVVDTWVMSCRAFSRRIEHRTLQELFDKFDLDQIVLQFTATERNSPISDFLQSMQPVLSTSKPPTIVRDAFQELWPSSLHTL
jgi:FkbH-like protein